MKGLMMACIGLLLLWPWAPSRSSMSAETAAAVRASTRKMSLSGDILFHLERFQQF
jgi:hypothetical protein